MMLHDADPCRSVSAHTGGISRLAEKLATINKSRAIDPHIHMYKSKSGGEPQTLQLHLTLLNIDL